MTIPLPVPLLAQWTAPVWVVLAVAVVLVAVVGVVLLDRARARRRTRAAEADTADLRTRLDALEQQVAARSAADPDRTASGAAVDPGEYVITSLGTPDAAPPEEAAARSALPAGAFADIVVRETVVYTASFVHGLRRGLSAEVRNRIRFEMKRELKRSRKARKVEVREALREYRARHRAEVKADDPTPDATGADVAPGPARLREDVSA